MYKVQPTITGVAYILVVTVAALAVAQDTPWTPPDPRRLEASSLPNYTGGQRVPGPPVAPTAAGRPNTWPGGPTPQPPGDEWQRRPSRDTETTPALGDIYPPAYMPPSAAGAAPVAPSLPPAYRDMYPPAAAPSAAGIPAAPVSMPAYREIAPPPFAPPSATPPVAAPAAAPPIEPAYAPPAYAPPGMPAAETTPYPYPAAAPVYPPAVPAAAPQPIYPLVGPPVTLVPPSAMPATAPLSPAPRVDAPITYPAPVAAMPLVPCERALMVAAVGAEAILASDLLAMAEENIERNMKAELEKQRKKLVDAGREEDLELLRQKFEQEQKKWMDELRAAISDATEGRIDADRMTPDQKARRQLLESLMKQQVELKLAYYDAKRKIPKENMPGVEKQITKHFDEVLVPKLMKDYNTDSYRDLDTALRRRGMSLERERRGFIERSLAQQWIQQQVKADEEANYEDMVAYYRDHPTEFDKPANTRWQLLNVSLSSYPSRREAYAKIAALGNRIQGGQDLAAVAKEGSDGTGGSDGKLRDWPDDAVHVPDVVKQAIEGLPPGQMSPVLEDWRGYYIVRVVERTAAYRQSFEAAQSDIREKIRQLRHTAQTDKYLADLRRTVPVWTVLDATQTASKPTSLLRY